VGLDRPLPSKFSQYRVTTRYHSARSKGKMGRGERATSSDSRIPPSGECDTQSQYPVSSRPLNPFAIPRNLEPCDPWQRAFPESWKSAYWRRAGGPASPGYECPGCHNFFTGPSGYSQMHSDHIKPYSGFDRSRTEGSPTVWENLQLLCGRCNLRKLNSEVLRVVVD
jgi:5-methylcytosine-specific restriction endonuclease McrA